MRVVPSVRVPADPKRGVSEGEEPRPTNTEVGGVVAVARRLVNTLTRGLTIDAIGHKGLPVSLREISNHRACVARRPRSHTTKALILQRDPTRR